MMQSQIENELRALRSKVEEMVDEAKFRENDWRRLGLISSVSGILLAVVGAGFLIANVTIERTSANFNFHDELVMMGITLGLLNIPLMILGAALRKRSPSTRVEAGG